MLTLSPIAINPYADVLSCYFRPYAVAFLLNYLPAREFTIWDYSPSIIDLSRVLVILDFLSHMNLPLLLSITVAVKWLEENV
jgi:hypothetical protein